MQRDKSSNAAAAAEKWDKLTYYHFYFLNVLLFIYSSVFFSVKYVTRFNVNDENYVVLFCFSLQARPGGRHHVEILRRSWISFLRRVLQVREDGQNWTRNIWVGVHHVSERKLSSSFIIVSFCRLHFELRVFRVVAVTGSATAASLGATPVGLNSNTREKNVKLWETKSRSNIDIFLQLLQVNNKSSLWSPRNREVFKAKHRQTGKKVALKKVLMENEKEGVRFHSASVIL